VRDGPIHLILAPWLAGREPDLDLAFELTGADVYARSLRARGHRVRFLVAGPSPGPAGARERWLATLNALDIACDELVSSDEARHVRVARALFLKLARQEDIYKAAHEGEEAYFLAVRKRLRPILEQLQAHPEFIQPPERRDALLRLPGEEGALDPLVARRRHGTGTGVPSDPGFVVEPWFDLLATYLTGCGYLDDPALMESCWPPHLQVVDEETLIVHAFAWPAMLAALGLSRPHRLLVRGNLRLEGIGPTDGAPPDLSPLALAARYGADATRYALLRNVSYVAGARLSPAQAVPAAREPFAEALQELLDTVLASLQAERAGVVPGAGPLGAAESQLLHAADAMAVAVAESIAAFDFQHALSHIGSTVTRALEYARRAGGAENDVSGPPERRRDLELFTLAEATRRIAWSLAPFLPRTAMAIYHCLGTEPRVLAPGGPPAAGGIPAGTRIRHPAGPLPLARGGGGSDAHE